MLKRLLESGELGEQGRDGSRQIVLHGSLLSRIVIALVYLESEDLRRFPPFVLSPSDFNLDCAREEL